MLSREKYGNDIPDRPPGSPDDDVADTIGIAVPLYCALHVVVSGRSLQSFGVMAPITTELRIVTELLPN